MNLLFDSHALVWWMNEDERFPPGLRRDLEAGLHGTAVSAASVWEVGIKLATGKLRLRSDVAAGVADAGFDPLVITFEHAVEAAQLPLHHRDPFDRMLVAQARVEGLVLVTRDQQIRRYEVPTLWE